MADATIFVVVARAIERLAVVAAGTICIWCGYQLFGSVQVNDSSASFKLGANVISLTKVGPGVLFAGFGIILLWRCISAVVTVGPAAETPREHGKSPPALVFGLPQRPSADLVRLRNDIAVLNALAETALPSNLDPADVERVIHQARVALLARSWDPGWGGEDIMQRLTDGQIPHEGALGELYRARLRSEFR